MIDLALHALAGAVFAVVMLWVLPPPTTMAPVVMGIILTATIFGIGRELWQSRLDTHGRWRLSAHRWLEALAWPVGAILGVGVFILV